MTHKHVIMSLNPGEYLDARWKDSRHHSHRVLTRGKTNDLGLSMMTKPKTTPSTTPFIYMNNLELRCKSSERALKENLRFVSK